MAITKRFASEEYVEQKIDDLLKNPPSSGGATTEQITEIINTALEQAKESGEFNGANGEDGQDGYTPQKGTDYFTEADKQELVDDVLEQVEIPSGGSEVTEAVKIAEISIDAEMAEATSIEITTEEYPELKNYNTLWFTLDNASNSTSPWIEWLCNGIKILKKQSTSTNGFRIVTRFRNGHAFGYILSTNPSLIPDNPYVINPSNAMGDISEAWRYVGEIESIKIRSHIKFLQENAKIYVYGWNE